MPVSTAASSRFGSSRSTPATQSRNRGAAASGAALDGSTDTRRPRVAGRRDQRPRRGARARPQQRVARDVQVGRVGGQRLGDQRGVRAGVGQHRPLAARLDEHEARPGRQPRVEREPQVDALRPQPVGRGAAGRVVADAPDQRHRRAGAREPGGDVRPGAAAALGDRGRRVAPVRDRGGERRRRRRA